MLEPVSILTIISSIFGVVSKTYEFAHRNGSAKRIQAGVDHYASGVDILYNKSGLMEEDLKNLLLARLLIDEERYKKLENKNHWSPKTWVDARVFHDGCSKTNIQIRQASFTVELLHLGELNEKRREETLESAIDDKLNDLMERFKKLDNKRTNHTNSADRTASSSRATSTVVRADRESVHAENAPDSGDAQELVLGSNVAKSNTGQETPETTASLQQDSANSSNRKQKERALSLSESS
ncbi:hypothetical protein B0H19DRAFT_1056782 [Mycena capillaripes]|nr:hypothetical protein B0H19DRAFT_1056782 [Mycena capillaripes]